MRQVGPYLDPCASKILTLISPLTSQKRINVGDAVHDLYAAARVPAAKLLGKTESLLKTEFKEVSEYRWNAPPQSIGSVWRNQAVAKKDWQITAVKDVTDMRKEALEGLQSTRSMDDDIQGVYIRFLKGLATYGGDVDARRVLEGLDAKTRLKHFIMTEGEQKTAGLAAVGVIGGGGLAGGALAIANN